jgi:sodium/potassium-transporting ATPase subunit alpha
LAVAIIDLDWHILTPDKIYEQLHTSPELGLASSDIVRLQKQYGKNSLSPPPSQWFRKTLKHLFGGFGSILLIAAILVFVAWKPLGNPPAIANLALAIVLLIVFAIQAFFSFYQGQ